MDNPPDYPEGSLLGVLRNALLPHGNATAQPPVVNLLARYMISPQPAAENALAQYSRAVRAVASEAPPMGSLYSMRLAEPPVSKLAELGLRHSEPEVPKELRRYVAWRKVAKSPDDIWARDRFNNLIYWPDYGKLTEHGWHIDHHPIPQCEDGRTTVSNIEALHWRANTALGGLLGSTRKG